MSNSFTAPSGGGDNRTKLPVPLLPNGTYPGILVSIVDCGTQRESFQGKPEKDRRVLKMSFEIPNQKAQFYAEEPELKPRQLTLDFTFMMYRNKTTNKKTNLLQFVESAVRVLQESEYNTFELSQMSGQYYNLNVVQYTKQDGTIGNKIGSVLPFTNYWPNENLTRTNDVHLYHISMGFDNLAFASLPFWLRDTIKKSQEAIAYGARGGKFAKLDENKNLVFEDAAPAQAGTQGIAPKVRMKNPQHDYQAFINLGWNDEMMVSQGYADWVQLPQAPTAPPPVPAAPASIAPPLVAQPQPPAAPPAAPQPKVIMNAGLDYQSHINIGWTDETLVANGHAHWNPAYQAPAPVAPPAPAPPPVPVAPPPPVPTAAPITPVAPAPMAPPAPVPIPAPAPVAAPQPPAGVPPYTPPPPAVNDVNQAIAAFTGAVVPPQSHPAPTPAPAPSQIPVEVPPMFNEEEHDDLPF